MGKWSQVRCNCPNRIPLPNSSSYDRPHRNYPYKKLSNRQKKEIKTWKENLENAYECGHDEGMLVQLCPGKIIELGFVLNQVFKNDLTFEIYLRIGNWRNYFSDGLAEEHRISPQEAELWLMEVAELEQAFLEQSNLPYRQVRQLISVLYESKLQSYYNLKYNLESIMEKTSFAGIVPYAGTVPLLQNLDRELKSPDVFREELFEILMDTTRLCQASIDSGNLIELLW